MVDYKVIFYEVCINWRMNIIGVAQQHLCISGIGLANGTINDIVDKVVKNKYKKSKWKTTVLIVDEVSMLSLEIFIIIDLIAKGKTKRNIPFGECK